MISWFFCLWQLFDHLAHDGVFSPVDLVSHPSVFCNMSVTIFFSASKSSSPVHQSYLWDTHKLLHSVFAALFPGRVCPLPRSSCLLLPSIRLHIYLMLSPGPLGLHPEDLPFTWSGTSRRCHFSYHDSIKRCLFYFFPPFRF